MLLNVNKSMSIVKNLTRAMSYVPKNRLDGKVAIVTASTDG